MNKCTFFSLAFVFAACACLAQSAANSDEICGKWMSSENNLIVQVYKENNLFKGKIVWFKNPDESRDMNEYYDIHNPNPLLRDRKLIGLNVLENLKFDNDTNTWENGTIYDATSGRMYSSAISMNTDKTIKVTGYWKFKFIGKSMQFKKVKAELAAK